MSSVRVLAVAGAAMWLTLPAAQAADLPPVAPPPMVYQPVEDFGGWYLRGDIGMSNQDVDHLDNVLYAGNTIQQIGYGFEAAPFGGLGIGYRFNHWLRLDVTGEYRGGATFHGLDIVNSTYTDEYTAIKSEWLFLANVYADLGTWWSVTPFVGLSAGVAFNKIGSFMDVNTPLLGVAYGGATWEANFAWAATAGLAYQVTRNFTVELAYRYLSLGDAKSGDIIAYDGTNTVYNPMLFKGITSQDFKLGVRFSLEPEPAPVMPPLMRKG